MTKTSPKGPYDNESDKRALSTNRRTGETPRAKLNNRLTSTIPKKVGVTGDRPILPDFHPPREPAALAQQLNRALRAPMVESAPFTNTEPSDRSGLAYRECCFESPAGLAVVCDEVEIKMDSARNLFVRDRRRRAVADSGS